MKKLSLIILISLLLSPLNSIQAKTNKATLTNGKNRVAVTIGSIQEKALFKGGYKLDKGLVGSVIPVTPALYESSLASPIGTTDTSMTVVKGTDISGTTLSGYMCFTVDSGSPSVEYICGTVAGTAVTSLLRGIDPITGITSVTALKQPHRRGASVKITDYPVLSILSRMLNGQDSIPNKMKYEGTVAINVGDASTTIVNKDYVDGITVSGAPNATVSVKGISQLSTGAQAASSTATGSTGSNLVIPTSITTSTAGTANTIPVTGGTGTIAPGFYQGNNHTFSGTNSFSGTTTISAPALNITASTTFSTATTTFTGGVLGAGFIHNQIITTTGNGTWTKPANVNIIRVRLVGAGGKGGGGTNGTSGGGGGGGGYSERIINVSATSSVAYYVGTSTNPTNFGSYLSATAGSDGAANGNGGQSGVGSGGDINSSGSGGTTPGNNGTGTFNWSGTGGASLLGGGGVGQVMQSNSSSNGTAGLVYGGGGGGGVTLGGSTSATGGAGAQGIIIIEY